MAKCTFHWKKDDRFNSTVAKQSETQLMKADRSTTRRRECNSYKIYVCKFLLPFSISKNAVDLT